MFFGCCSDAGEQLLPLAAPVRLGAPTSLPAAQPVPGAGLLPVAAAAAQRHRGVLPAAQHRNALLHLLLHGGTYDQCVRAFATRLPPPPASVVIVALLNDDPFLARNLLEHKQYMLYDILR